MPLDDDVVWGGVGFGGGEGVAVGGFADGGVLGGGAEAVLAGFEVFGVVDAWEAGRAEAEGEFGGGFVFVGVGDGAVGFFVVEGDGDAVGYVAAEAKFAPVAGVFDVVEVGDGGGADEGLVDVGVGVLEGAVLVAAGAGVAGGGGGNGEAF